MEDIFEIKLYLKKSECLALAQMMKRLTHSDFESLSKNESEKREMVHGCVALAVSLKEKGFDPA